MPSYVLRYCFGIYVSVRTYNIRKLFQNSTVLTDCYCMDWRDCNRMDWRGHSIGTFVQNIVIDFKLGIFHIQICSMNFPNRFVVGDVL